MGWPPLSVVQAANAQATASRGEVIELMVAFSRVRGRDTVGDRAAKVERTSKEAGQAARILQVTLR
jgi:hypothetical protein